MNEKLLKYLDGVFAPYEDLQVVKELKEELYVNFQEKLIDFKNQGHDDEMAYRMTIESIGDIDEIMASIPVQTRESKQANSDLKGAIKEIFERIADKTRGLMQKGGSDFSRSHLQDSDFSGVIVHDGKFNYSDLKGSDFSGADLANSSFKCCNLKDVKFDGANLTGAKLRMANLKNASFKSSILDYTDFSYSSLSGNCFDHQTFIGTIFNGTAVTGSSFKHAEFKNISIKHSDFSNAILDGAKMDKLTYAVLKGMKVDLANVSVID